MKDEKLYLIRWGDTAGIVKRLQAEIKEYQDIIDESRDLTGLAMDGMPHGSTPGNPTERKAFRAMALEDNYSDFITARQKQIERTLRDKLIIDKIIDRYEPWVRTMLELRYVKRKDWFEISFAVEYSDGHIKNVHTRVLKDISKVMTQSDF